MAFQIGQCCTDQIIPSDPGGGSGSSSGLNEYVPFSNVSTLRINLTGARRTRFGDILVIQVFIIGEDGKYRLTSLETVPDQVPDTNWYDIDLGGLSSGYAVIT